jgi:hypothetical protein
MRDDSAASAIHGIIFGAFCAFIVIAAVVFILVENNQSGAVTDTSGNTLTPVSNQSQSLATTTLLEGDNSAVLLLFVIGAVFIGAILFIGLGMIKSSLDI